ncbi:hypothetical protein QP794_25230 [Paenibacillus sp. UMB7766-LJ446]|nr:hypothetical protein [Paenibacillus sp. UMB7766-LJ446]
MFSDMILYRLSYGDNGYTLEEMKMVRETKKIMGTLCWYEQLPVPYVPFIKRAFLLAND